MNCHRLGLLRTHGKQARRTAELTSLLALAEASKREPEKRRIPTQNSLHRSVVKLIIDDYHDGASLYGFADRYKVRRNTVRDTLRRAGFDTSVKAHWAALTEAQKEEVREKFASGTAKRELAVMFDVSETTIERALQS